MTSSITSNRAGRSSACGPRPTRSTSRGQDLCQVFLEQQAMARRLRPPGAGRDLGQPPRPSRQGEHARHPAPRVREPPYPSRDQGRRHLGPDRCLYRKSSPPGRQPAACAGPGAQGMKADRRAARGKKNDPMMPVAWTKTYTGTEGKTARRLHDHHGRRHGPRKRRLAPAAGQRGLLGGRAGGQDPGEARPTSRSSANTSRCRSDSAPSRKASRPLISPSNSKTNGYAKRKRYKHRLRFASEVGQTQLPCFFSSWPPNSKRMADRIL